MRTIKKILAGLLVVVMLMTAVPMLALTASAVEVITEGDFQGLVLADGTVQIIGYNGSDEKLSVPSTLDGRVVTEIGKRAFVDNSTIVAELPATVKHIRAGAFEMNGHLVSITLRDGLETIGIGAFLGCRSLEYVEIPESVTMIGASAFNGCWELNYVNIPEGVTAIENYTFGMCAAMKSIVLPSTLKRIGEQAFANCYALQTIAVPEGVTTIGAKAFSQCTSLEIVTLPKTLQSVDVTAFDQCENIWHVLCTGTSSNFYGAIAALPSTTTVHYRVANASLEAMITQLHCMYNGEAVFYCTLCGDEYAMELPSVGHFIQGDSCTCCHRSVIDCLDKRKRLQSFDEENIVTYPDATSVTVTFSEDTYAKEENVLLIYNENYRLVGAYTGTSLAGQTVTVPGGTVVIKGCSYSFDNQYDYRVTSVHVTGRTYPDVVPNAWYYDAVSYVSDKGYMSGYASGYFGPAHNLQRQDFVVTLARVAGADLSAFATADSGLSDVKAGSYYAPAVAWAVENGIITGYQNGEFGVGDSITREQVATILYRFKDSPAVENAEETLAAFPDSARVSPFATDALAWAVQNGVISGSNGNLAPTASASRAQIATILMRMDQNGLL